MHEIVFQNLSRPDPELRGLFRIHTVTNSNDHIKTIVIRISCHPSTALVAEKCTM